MPGREVLLTGATGFVGKVVLEALLRQREALGVERVHVLVRTGGANSAGARFAREVAASPCFDGLEPGWAGRVEVVEGDLLREGCGLAEADRARLAESVTHVLHVAASVDFDLPLHEADAVNVGGSLHVLELARACRRLERMVSVSTAYVTPHPGDGVPVREELAPLPRPAAEIRAAVLEGRADERALLAETGHPNTYTLTKCLAEHLLVERRGDLPLALVRPSIVSAALRHPHPGWIDSAAAFAGFVALVGSGHLRAVAANPQSRVDIVPVDVVAERILDTAFTGPAPGAETPVVHAVVGLDRSPSIEECRAWLTDFFRRHPVDRRPAVPYLGPPGPRLRLAHWRHHELPLALAAMVSKRARRGRATLRARIRALNRAFVYFTHHTFDFRSSAPPPAELEPQAYVETVCRGIHRHLLRRDDREVPLAGRRGPDLGGDVRFVLRQPAGGPWVRTAAWLVTKTLRRATDLVSFDLASFEAARRAVPEDATMVLAPSHRSYLDFVLCSYLGFARPDLGIAIPHVAAAMEFARLPILGRILRDLGAFYLRRGLGREDKELTRQVHALVREGRTLEFFIEGGRSRGRSFLPPRRGMLRCLQATGGRFALLPVAVSYDRVPEEASFLRELSGEAKPPMQLGALLAWTGRMLRGRVKLGRVHIACGRPVLLDLSGEVEEVSRELVAELQDATAATTLHLRAFLAAAGLEGVRVRALREAIEARGGRVLESPLRPEPDLPPRLEATFRHQFAHRFFPEARALYGAHPVVADHLARNDFRQAPAASGAEPDELGLRVVRALLEPLCRDYVRVGEILGEPGRPLGAETPRALLREVPECHLPHVEAAFADLVQRGILACDPQSGRHRWGPRAAEIVRWRALAAWPEEEALGTRRAGRRA